MIAYFSITGGTPREWLILLLVQVAVFVLVVFIIYLVNRHRGKRRLRDLFSGYGPADNQNQTVERNEKQNADRQ